VSRADLLLLLVSAIWGTTFSLLRESLRVIHPVELMAIRFSLAAIVLVAVFGQRLWPIRRRWLFNGAWLGVWLSAGYLTQVIGLATITAARSAFITSTYVVFTPFLAIPLGAGAPGLGDLLGVALAFGGISLFNADAGFALSFGIQIVITNIVAKKHDPIALSVVQIVVGALFGWIFVAARGGFQTPPERIPWGILVYLAVVATALVILIQTWALARTTPVKAALIFSTEPIFATIFAVSFFGESMTGREVLGGVLIVSAVVITEMWRPLKARLGMGRVKA
jgi:drug/metabolite transporter (DMT)-like permease